LQAHHRALAGDVRKLVETYHAIFEWNVLDMDWKAADRLILAEIRKASDDGEMAR
jgi:hypothetical protein